MHVCCLTQEFFIQQQGLQTVLYTSDRARVENDAHQQSSGIAERQQRCFTQLANSKPHIWKPVENLLKYGVLRVWIWKLPGRHGSDPRPKPTGATSIRKLPLLCWNSFYIYIVYIVYRYIHSILYIYIHTYIHISICIYTYISSQNARLEPRSMLHHAALVSWSAGDRTTQDSAIAELCNSFDPLPATCSNLSVTMYKKQGKHKPCRQEQWHKGFFGCPLAIATVQTEML